MHSKPYNGEPFDSLWPGDCLIYWENSVVDWIIAVKTWTFAGHVEIYDGNGQSLASRNGVGVNRYRLRRDGLIAVRRPKSQPDFAMVQPWFDGTARGQKYDFLGLLCFTLAVRRGSKDRMYCSEFATRWYRHAGVIPFDPDWDADWTPPSFFLVTPELYTVWRRRDQILLASG